jgi:bacteriorhodopsin
MYDITPVGQGFLWMSIYSMLFFSGVYLKSIFRIKQKTVLNYAFRITLFCISFITMICHSLSATVLLTDIPLHDSMDPHHCEYAKWLLVTPLFILLISWLQKSRRLHTAILITADTVMIVCGYGAFLSESDTQFWQLFIFATCIWSFIVIQLIRKTYEFYYNGYSIQMMFLNRAIFSLLVGLIIISWSAYPVVVVLKRNNIISLSTEFILYSLFDCLNKGYYGLLFLGAKEIEEKIESRLTNHVRTLTQILPIKSVYSKLQLPVDSIDITSKKNSKTNTNTKVDIANGDDTDEPNRNKIIQILQDDPPGSTVNISIPGCPDSHMNQGTPPQKIET